MSPDHEQPELDEQTIHELAQLADGSLGGWERAELEARVAHSPTLRAALERQRAGAGALRGLDLQPRPSLRERIATESAPAPRRARGRRLRIGGALAGAAALIVLAAVLILPSGGANPTVVETAQLADRPATGTVGVDPSNERLLAASVEGVPFPNWRREFGWHQAGTRSDELGGRTARTVFYENGGRRAAYTIVSGKGIPPPGGSTPATSNGVHVHSLADGGRRAVTWWRDGRTCVLSSADVGSRKLIQLATWKGDGAVPF
jgi:hypothetical protein